MRQELSSDSTRLWKFYFPIGWISFMGIGALLALTKLTVEPTAALFVVGWLIGSSWLYRFASRLKRVALDDNYLYISDYKKEIQLPLSSIEAVGENFLTNPKQVTITLRSPSEFGRKIAFVPERKQFDAFRFHPVVEQLREIIRQHSSSNGPGRSARP
jgi:hypothetical protein